jgi:hypothetical protein
VVKRLDLKIQPFSFLTVSPQSLNILNASKRREMTHTVYKVDVVGNDSNILHFNEKKRCYLRVTKSNGGEGGIRT